MSNPVTRSEADDQQAIARIAGAARIWAVASIHGHAQSAAALHREIASRVRSGDRFVYLGNYLGRGPNCLALLDELLAFRHELAASTSAAMADFVYLRGAQEEMWAKLLKLQMALQPQAALEWMLAHGVEETLQAYGSSGREGLARCREGVMSLTRWTGRLRRAMQARSGHFELMTSLKHAARTECGRLLFVHASIDPSRPLHMQGDIFWWDNRTFEKIDRPFDGFRRVIRGYDHKRRGLWLDNPHAATIDGGCSFGGPLNAVCFGLDGQVLDQVSVSV